MILPCSPKLGSSVLLELLLPKLTNLCRLSVVVVALRALRVYGDMWNAFTIGVLTRHKPKWSNASTKNSRATALHMNVYLTQFAPGLRLMWEPLYGRYGGAKT